VDDPGVGADRIRPTPHITQSNFHRKPRSLSSFVAGFKAAVTSRVKKECAVNIVWQRNYYDHIIRNEQELNKIWDYMDNNPRRWEEDQLNPAAPLNRFNQD
jgi:REP element-mobilizing transposase RayT